MLVLWYKKLLRATGAHCSLMGGVMAEKASATGVLFLGFDEDDSLRKYWLDSLRAFLNQGEHRLVLLDTPAEVDLSAVRRVVVIVSAAMAGDQRSLSRLEKLLDIKGISFYTIGVPTGTLADITFFMQTVRVTYCTGQPSSAYLAARLLRFCELGGEGVDATLAAEQLMEATPCGVGDYRETIAKMFRGLTSQSGVLAEV